jgi:DNA-binding NarL/FixJ family response regulator
VTEVQLLWAKSPHASANPSPTKSDKKPDELLEICAKAVQTRPGLSQRELRVLRRTEQGSAGFSLLAYDPAIARGLSLRELEISTLVGLNLGNKGIARHLGLSESTVKAHLQVIYRKTGLGTRAALARYALVALAKPHCRPFGLVPLDN